MFWQKIIQALIFVVVATTTTTRADSSEEQRAGKSVVLFPAATSFLKTPHPKSSSKFPLQTISPNYGYTSNFVAPPFSKQQQQQPQNLVSTAYDSPENGFYFNVVPSTATYTTTTLQKQQELFQKQQEQHRRQQQLLLEQQQKLIEQNQQYLLRSAIQPAIVAPQNHLVQQLNVVQPEEVNVLEQQQQQQQQQLSPYDQFTQQNAVLPQNIQQQQYYDQPGILQLNHDQLQQQYDQLEEQQQQFDFPKTSQQQRNDQQIQQQQQQQFEQQQYDQQQYDQQQYNQQQYNQQQQQRDFLQQRQFERAQQLEEEQQFVDLVPEARLIDERPGFFIPPQFKIYDAVPY